MSKLGPTLLPGTQAEWIKALASELGEVGSFPHAKMEVNTAFIKDIKATVMKKKQYMWFKSAHNFNFKNHFQSRIIWTWVDWMQRMSRGRGKMMSLSII